MWVAVVGLAALAAFQKSADLEYWFHLAAGRSISQHGLPNQEIWTQAARGQSPSLSEWLFHVALYQVHRFTGDWGIALWRSAWAAAAMALAIRLAFLLDAATWSIVLLAPLLLVASRDGFEPRPAALLVPFLLFAVVRFEEARRVRDRTRWLIPVQVLWANLQASWVFGPLVAWIYAATAWLDHRRARRAMQKVANQSATSEFSPSEPSPPLPPANMPRSRVAAWAVLGLLLLAASAVVPRPRIWLSYPLAFLIPRFDPMGSLHELRGWTWADDRTDAFTALLALWLIALLIGGQRMWKKSPALTLIAMAGMAMGAIAFRWRGFAAWTSFAALAVAFAPRGPRLARAALLVPTAAAALFAGYVLVTSPPSLGAHPRLDAVPVRAAALAESLHLEGPMLNTFHQGGYLLWVRGEKNPPLIDGRGRAPLALRSLYAKALNDQFALDSLLEQGDFNYLVLQPPQSQDERMAVNVARRLEWGLIHIDDAGLLYVRWNRYPGIAAPRAYRYFTPDYIGMLSLSEQAKTDSGLRVRLEEELRRARAASPAHARASLWLGLLAMDRNDAPEAVKYLDEAERIAPEMPGLALRQGFAHEMIGDRKGAMAAYRRALRDEEDSGIARASLQSLQKH